jgi:hypothetical protein
VRQQVTGPPHQLAFTSGSGTAHTSCPLCHICTCCVTAYIPSSKHTIAVFFMSLSVAPSGISPFHFLAWSM